MLTSLTISGYRGFEGFSVSSLGRVNLIVGKNNSGKTSLLEAVQLCVTESPITAIREIATRRGELASGSREQDVVPIVSHFFSKHRLAADAKFSVRNGKRGAQREFAIVVEPDVQLREMIPGPAAVPGGPALVITEGAGGRIKTVIPINERGAISYEGWSYRLRFDELEENRSKVRFISPESLSTSSMASLFDDTILAGYESHVIDALRILMPEVSSIRFLTGEAYRRSGRGGVVLGTSFDDRLLPLGSFGDGLRRLLALSLSLISARGGTLLIDEIDTGLHYTAMEALWKLIVEGSALFNVSIFATTHSKDCIEGLREFALRNSHKEVRVVNVTKGRKDAGVFAADDLDIALTERIEMR